MLSKIKQLYQQNTHMILLLGGSLIGILCFICVYGIRILDVTYVDWLINQGDVSQHYFGWIYYRDTPWSFPLGQIEGLTDQPLSFIYMDVIPLFALIFKMFRAILPDTFQYFGLWGLLSFALTGLFATLLIRRFTNRVLNCWIGSVFFVLSPYILQRMFAHTALAGQWILLLALNVWLYQWGKQHLHKKILIWSGILCLAGMIHMYFIPMVVVFILMDAVNYAWENKKVLSGVAIFLIPVLVTLLELFGLGAFSTTGAMADGGLGSYSANLLSFINPIEGSAFLKQHAQGTGQYEGMGYLGAGIMILAILAFYILLCNRDSVIRFVGEKQHAVGISVLGTLCFGMLALSPTVTLGERALFTIPYPKFIIDILSIFRCSGRFIWPLCYAIFLFVIACICRKGKCVSLVLAVCLVVQIVDLQTAIRPRHERFSAGVEYTETELRSDAWDEVLADKDKLILFPYDYAFYNDNYRKLYELAYMGSDGKIQFNSFIYARMDYNILEGYQEQYIHDLESGQGHSEYLYVFNSENEMQGKDYHLNYYKIDGVIVGMTDVWQDWNDYDNVEKLE